MSKPMMIATLLLPMGSFVADVSPARAETLVSQKVSYADLDLSTEAGRKRLDSRIRWTIRGICGAPENTSFLGERAAMRRCASEAFERTRGQVAYAVAQAEHGKERQLASR